MLALKERIRYWSVGLGIITGILFCVSSLATGKAPVADDFLSGIFVGGRAGLFTGMAWYFVVAVLTFGYQHILAPPFRFLGRWRARAAERRARRGDEKRRWKQQREYDRGAPERARLAANQAADQKRRDDARASCELLYTLYAPEIADRYPRTVFDAFMTKYMGDAHPPEYVEERAEQLQSILRQHHEKVQPSLQFKTLAEIAEWFRKQKDEIDASPVDDPTKRVLLVQLKERYHELTANLLEKM